MYVCSRNYRTSRRTELLGATSMEGITASDWTKDYAEKSPVQISSTDVQREITLSNNPKAAAGGVVEGWLLFLYPYWRQTTFGGELAICSTLICSSRLSVPVIWLLHTYNMEFIASVTAKMLVRTSLCGEFAVWSCWGHTVNMLWAYIYLAWLLKAVRWVGTALSSSDE